MSHYDREWSPDEPETAATATPDAPIDTEGTSGCHALAEASVSLGKPISLKVPAPDALCKCGHPKSEHYENLLEWECEHKGEWFEPPRCKCREFVEVA